VEKGMETNQVLNLCLQYFFVIQYIQSKVVHHMFYF
jgi:hypothetical protein